METVQLIRDIVIIASGLFVIVAVVYVVPLLGSVRRLSDESTRTVRTMTDAVAESHRKSIGPALEHVEEMTDRLNRTVKEASYAVEEGVRFTRQTIEQATYYRDRVFQPLIEIASLWRGIQAIKRALPRRRSSRRNN